MVTTEEPWGDAAPQNRLLQAASPTAMQSGWFFQIPRPVPAPATPRDKEAGSSELGRGQERHPGTREQSAGQASACDPGRGCHLHRRPPPPAAPYPTGKHAPRASDSSIPGVSAPAGKAWSLGCPDKVPRRVPIGS